MVFFEPQPLSPEIEYKLSQWTLDECLRFYVKQRRKHCTFQQVMDLGLLVPCCEECVQSEPLGRGTSPDIGQPGGDLWEEDVEYLLGLEFLEEVRACLADDADYAFECKTCGRHLRPWKGDQVWILFHHLEEHYGIPVETPGKATVPERFRKLVKKLYDYKCFRCGTTKGVDIDHIIPTSKGGTAAFRNLQPLCRPCNQLKRDSEPEEVIVRKPLYFNGSPSDSYEGLFW